MPDPVRIERIEEPFIRAQIITKPDYIGNIITLCLGKRGILLNQSYLTPTRVELSFEMPLTEIVFDFYDKLKSQTRGYASFDYYPIENRDSDIKCVDSPCPLRRVWQKALRKIKRTGTPPAVPDSHTGRHWRKNCCQGDHLGHAQRCNCQMLWW
jgi:translation elongation factor EF-G